MILIRQIAFLLWMIGFATGFLVTTAQEATSEPTAGENTIAVELAQNVPAKVWIEDSAGNIQPVNSWSNMRLIPEEEYTVHARSIGYLPYDQPLMADVDTTTIIVELEPDPNWIVIDRLLRSDAAGHYGIRLYDNGFAWLIFNSQWEWRYYDPENSQFSMLATDFFWGRNPTLSEETLEQLGVSEDEGGFYQVQFLSDENWVVYPSNDGLMLTNLETDERVNLSENGPQNYQKYYGRIRADGNYYVYPWQENRFVRGAWIITLHDQQVEHVPLWNFIGLDGVYSEHDIDILVGSPDGDYLLVIGQKYNVDPFPETILWFYDAIKDEVVELGLQSFFSYAIVPEAGWREDGAFVVGFDGEVFEYNAETREKRILLTKDEFNIETIYSYVLSSDGRWIAVRHRETIVPQERSGILFRWLDD